MFLGGQISKLPGLSQAHLRPKDTRGLSTGVATLQSPFKRCLFPEKSEVLERAVRMLAEPTLVSLFLQGIILADGWSL